MKKLFVFFLLICSPPCFSQQTIPPAAMTQSDYLVKAKKQNTAAWILLGGGFGLSTAGIIVGNKEVENSIYDIFETGETRTSSVGAVLLIAGGAVMLGSIPFFVSASENKKKAAAAPVSLTFKMETQLFIRQVSLVKTSYPAISLRFVF